jgi:hypothetical protein
LNIYVKSEMAGQHAMAAITNYLERKLKLRVNREKSAVARPWARKFLGYSFAGHKQAGRSIQPLVTRSSEPEDSTKGLRGNRQATDVAHGGTLGRAT